MIVAVTGHVGESYDQKAKLSGMDKVLAKPPAEDKFKECLVQAGF